MGNVTVIGAQWGDEGKGKIVDWLSERADIVVRFQGGHNAGHTVVIGESTYKLSLLPSGILRGKISVIGNGVVVDPWVLIEEIERLCTRGIKVDHDVLKIADNACLILPVHSAIDRLRDEECGEYRLGTTGRGIGPAYEDKVARRAIRICDLQDPSTLKRKVEELLKYHNTFRRSRDLSPLQVDELYSDLVEISPHILLYAKPVWSELHAARRSGKRLLFEGAQAVMLDVDHGTYPYVTSSNTVAANAGTGSGVGPLSAGYVLGISKAYTTRVGAGPFPTELTDDTGRLLGERGREFGTVTGRPRRCGWFDAVMVRQAVSIGGIAGIALTKLDVLDDLPLIKLCVGYEIFGQQYDYLPAAATMQAAAKPIYATLPGWKESTRGARSWRDLPAEAVKYVRRIEELIGAPVTLLSTSPERKDTICVKDPFAE